MGTLEAFLDLFSRVAFTFGPEGVTYAELFGFVTGAACVALTVRAHVANFPVGLANTTFFGLLFLASHLYANAALQLVFFALGVIGWWQWARPAAPRAGETEPPGQRPVTHAAPWAVAVAVVCAAAATAGLTFALRAADDPAPFWDALTTALSLAAQFFLNTKQVESWYFWIVADVIYVPLYYDQKLVLTAIVYALFLVLAVLGLRDWRRAARRADGYAAGDLTSGAAGSENA